MNEIKKYTEKIFDDMNYIKKIWINISNIFKNNTYNNKEKNKNSINIIY